VAAVTILVPNLVEREPPVGGHPDAVLGDRLAVDDAVRGDVAGPRRRFLQGGRGGGRPFGHLGRWPDGGRVVVDPFAVERTAGEDRRAQGGEGGEGGSSSHTPAFVACEKRLSPWLRFEWCRRSAY